MSRIGRLAFALVFGLGAAADAAAPEAPTTISYQGVLLDSVGDPRTGPVDLTLRLYDARGVLNYEAVGYIYKSDQYYKIRYTPAAALRGMNDLAAEGALPSQSKPGTLQLIFRVSAGAEIIGFGVGNKMLVDWSETPILIEGDRR